MVFTKSCELWLCIFDIKPKLAKPFCLGSSEKTQSKGTPYAIPCFQICFLYHSMATIWGASRPSVISVYWCVSKDSQSMGQFLPAYRFFESSNGHFGACFAQHQNTYWFYILWYPHDILEKGFAYTPYKGCQRWKIAAARHLGIPRASIVLGPNPQQFRICTTN